jgi:catechol 2,3-dioxygenase-like lactoylglutathione lyase family enzyme
MIPLIKIKETCLYIHDLDRALKFYHELLELPVINFEKGKHLFLRAGESVLLIFNPDDSRMKKSPPAHFGGGKQHFAFEVQAGDYETTKQKILNKNIPIIEEVIWKSGAKSFYFNDWDGNVLEILPARGVWD